MRKVPVSAWLAFGAWIAWTLVRLVATSTSVWNAGPTQSVISNGVSFAAHVLLIVYALEMANRGGTRAACFSYAAAAVTCSLALDVAGGLIPFTEHPWDHVWFYRMSDYTGLACWTVFALALAQSLEPCRRVFGYVITVVAFVAWMPAFLMETLIDPLHLSERADGMLLIALSLARFVGLGWLAIAASAGETAPSPSAAAAGLRMASSAMWLRTVMVIAFSLLPVLLFGSMRGVLLTMLVQDALWIIALVILGVGCLRVVRARVRELESWTLGIAGAALLWSAGVSLAQLPFLAHVLNGAESPYISEYARALALANPLVAIVATGLLPTALSGFAARTGNEALRGEARRKGFWFVVLMLGSFALQSWMVQRFRSLHSYSLLSLVIAVTAVIANVMIAKLLRRGAGALEAAPGLPHASVVSASPSET